MKYAFYKIVLLIVERIFVSLSLSLLRDSPDFGTHLVYILLADTTCSVAIILSVDCVYPWLKTVRVSVERNARFVVFRDEEEAEEA